MGITEAYSRRWVLFSYMNISFHESVIEFELNEVVHVEEWTPLDEEVELVIT